MAEAGQPLWATLTPEEFAERLEHLTPVERDEVEQLLRAIGGIASDPVVWVTDNFPEVAQKPFADRHRRLWAWFDSLTPNVKPLPKIEAWPRGGAKSTTGELGVAFVGMKLSRRFVLYVCATQDQADLHVQSIATLLGKLGVSPKLNVVGKTKGWRRSQLQTDTGFNVAAYGLDKATRGIKIDHYRPDLIILDDVDSDTDSPKTVEKKIRSISSAVIPAGSADCAVLFLQNLIYEDSVISQIIDGRAEILLDREPDTIEPAVLGLEVAKETKKGGGFVYRITAGTPTWEGQDIATCESQINERGLRAFRRESQHEVHGSDGFFFDETAFRIVEVDEIPKKLTLWRTWDLAATQGGGDFTVGVLMGYDKAARQVYVLDVKRHQFGSSKVRELILETALRDASGSIFEQDEYDHRGKLIESGRFFFNFLGLVRIGIPQDPGAAGKTESDNYRELLADYPLTIYPISGSKAIRARPWADQVNAGRVALVRAPWNHAYKEEHRKFKEDETHDYDDQIDPSADAWNRLEGRRIISSTSVVSSIAEEQLAVNSPGSPSPELIRGPAINNKPGIFIPPATIKNPMRSPF